MGRITKEIAEGMAYAVTEGARMEYVKAYKKLEECVLAIAQDKVPKLITEASEKHRDYFDWVNHIYLNGFGFKSTCVTATNKVVSNHGNWSKNIEVTREDSEQITPLFHDSENKEKVYKDLLAEVERTLYMLRTTNKVRKEFPEAIPFLPKETTEVVAIPMDDLRERLSEYKNIQDGKV